MSLKSRLLKSSLLKGTVKLAIKLTPSILVVSIANLILKGVAEFSAIEYDLDKRTAFVKLTLYGEEEAIEVSVNGFGILKNGDKYQFVLHHARSNKLWMTNILSRVIGKKLDIPDIPQFRDEVMFVASLLESKESEQQENTTQKATQLA